MRARDEPTEVRAQRAWREWFDDGDARDALAAASRDDVARSPTTPGGSPGWLKNPAIMTSCAL